MLRLKTILVAIRFQLWLLLLYVSSIQAKPVARDLLPRLCLEKWS